MGFAQNLSSTASSSRLNFPSRVEEPSSSVLDTTRKWQHRLVRGASTHDLHVSPAAAPPSLLSKEFLMGRSWIHREPSMPAVPARSHNVMNHNCLPEHSGRRRLGSAVPPLPAEHPPLNPYAKRPLLSLLRTTAERQTRVDELGQSLLQKVAEDRQRTSPHGRPPMLRRSNPSPMATSEPSLLLLKSPHEVFSPDTSRRYLVSIAAEAPAAAPPAAADGPFVVAAALRGSASLPSLQQMSSPQEGRRSRPTQHHVGRGPGEQDGAASASPTSPTSPPLPQLRRPGEAPSEAELLGTYRAAKRARERDMRAAEARRSPTQAEKMEAEEAAQTAQAAQAAQAARPQPPRPPEGASAGRNGGGLGITPGSWVAVPSRLLA